MFSSPKRNTETDDARCSFPRMRLSWRDVLIYKRTPATIECVFEAARWCGYKYFLWEGYIYEVQTKAFYYELGMH